jgi:hypothetical protein
VQSTNYVDHGDPSSSQGACQDEKDQTDGQCEKQDEQGQGGVARAVAVQATRATT